MARDFSTRTDIDKTELAKYPNGRIKDGITDGTKAGEEVVGDFQQVFLKAMRDSGITPNGLPDNETNGWQMFEAMKFSMMGKSDFVECILDSPNAFVTGSPRISARKYGDYIHIFGVYKNNTDGNGFTLPAGLIPVLPILPVSNQFKITDGVKAMVDTWFSYVYFVVESDGRVFVPGGSPDDYFFFDCMIPNGITV